MFLDIQDKADILNYKRYLKAVSSLSGLYSSSNVPFLHYRAAENVFCRAFDAENLARGDIAYDACKDGFGVGLKTFVMKGGFSSEKVAEFNAFSNVLRRLKGKRLLLKLIELRNERIYTADRAYKITNRVYHCVGRSEGVLKVFETSYDLIDVDTARITGDNKSSLKFEDKFSEYSFNYSKSTIFKKFNLPDNVLNIPVKVLSEPLDTVAGVLSLKPSPRKVKSKYGINLKVKRKTAGNDFVFLPLYSAFNKKQNKKPFVPKSSQLNQWNATGRKRSSGEVYIHIPAIVHKLKPGFFPLRDKKFSLLVPTGESYSAKVCQDGSKALMTDPNDALAGWLLRGILNLDEYKLLNYRHLEAVGVDCVCVTKLTQDKFKIDFAELGTYEKFIDGEDLY